MGSTPQQNQASATIGGRYSIRFEKYRVRRTPIFEKYFGITAANNALPKVRAGQTNFGCSSLSALVWGGTLSK